MSLFKYIAKDTSRINVHLDNKSVGYLSKSKEGWRYIPKAGKKHASDYFNSLEEVIKEIEQ